MSELIPKLQSQSKLNPNQIQSIFCSSFFLCLQGQLQSCFSFFVHLHGEPFSSYHLLQSCFSFFIHLHGQTEPFGSCIILQSCSSYVFLPSPRPTWGVCYRPPSPALVFSPTHFHHLASIFWEWPGAVSRGLLFLTTFSFPLVIFSCSIFFMSYPQPFFPLFFGL